MPDSTLLPGPVPLTMRRGVTFGPLTFELEDANGSAVNLTGFTPRWIARPEIPSPNQYDFGPALSGTPTDGKVIITQTDEETLRDWPAGSYQHALTLEDGTGQVFGPYIAGPLTVEDQAARP